MAGDYVQALVIVAVGAALVTIGFFLLRSLMRDR